MLADFAGKRVLLLQGPNGPLFRRLGRGLVEVGASVTKINLNAADQLFYGGGEALAFRGHFDEWPAFLARVIEERQIDCAFLFGDLRPYHRAAAPVLERHGVELFVVEEGYLRPDHITIEPAGVNANSRMSRRPDDYVPELANEPEIRHVQHAFAWSVWFTILNSLCVTLGRAFYPHYRHHRDVTTWRQAFFWARGFWRRFRHLRREKRVLGRLSGPLSKRYFLAALQVHNDYQIAASRFSDVRDFIHEVVDSFAKSARPDDYLVVKHHPADRAYRDYGQLLRELARTSGLGERLIYLHDPHLPTLLRHARGTVVINSTIAFSSFHHRAPVLALGVAVYQWMGLCADGSLAEFWQAPPEVDVTRYHRARRWLLEHNQANGSVWVKLPGAGASGLFWPPSLRPRPPTPLVERSLAGLDPRPRLSSSPHGLE